jgi:hypothetical protein
MDHPMTAIDIAPDWTALKADLHCPLCEYNLRGLDQPRCPECGFAFAWSELIRGQQEIHPYLFEHQNRRNVWSFWKTYWTDCRPRNFWGQVNPAYPVHVWRLLLFWMISYIGVAITLLSPVAWQTWHELDLGNPSSLLNRNGSWIFDRLLNAVWDCSQTRGGVTLICGAMTVLAWPWMTFICLQVFLQSMRIAKINKRHVLRAVIYGSDCSLILLLFIWMGWGSRYSGGYPLMIAFLCCGITLYRTTIAYRKYLRFHLPFLTVLTSQVIVLMIVYIAYLSGYTH